MTCEASTWAIGRTTGCHACVNESCDRVFHMTSSGAFDETTRRHTSPSRGHEMLFSATSQSHLLRCVCVCRAGPAALTDLAVRMERRRPKRNWGWRVKNPEQATNDARPRHLWISCLLGMTDVPLKNANINNIKQHGRNVSVARFLVNALVFFLNLFCLFFRHVLFLFLGLFLCFVCLSLCLHHSGLVV